MAHKSDPLEASSWFSQPLCLHHLGVSRYEQWTEHLSTVQMNEEFGMSESIHEVVTKHHLRWLGHVARMSGDRMPKQILFRELKKSRLGHETKKRRRDVVNEDLKLLGL